MAAFAIYTKNADGSGLFAHPLSWSHDGRWLVAQVSDPTGAFDLWIVPMAEQGEPRLYRRTPGDEKTAAISPDGRWLAYAAIEDGKWVAYVESFAEPGAAVPDRGRQPGRVQVVLGWPRLLDIP